MPRRYARIFDRLSRRDLELAQIAGIVAALHDQVAAGTRLARDDQRAIWIRAIRLAGRCAS